MARVINKFGKLIGWASMTTNFLGRDLEGITAVEYSDEQDIQAAFGAGVMPVGFIEGNYKATASITVYKDELNALMNSLPKGMRLQNIPPFPVVVNYENGDNVFKDVIQNCIIVKAPNSLKQGDGKSEVKLDLFCTHIDWNV